MIPVSKSCIYIPSFWTSIYYFRVIALIYHSYQVDSRVYGNVTRFIRRADSAAGGRPSNLIRKLVFADHRNHNFPRLALFAARDLYAGEELLL